MAQLLRAKLLDPSRIRSAPLPMAALVVLIFVICRTWRRGMRYALLLHLDPEVAERTTAEEADAELAAYAEITEQLEATGVLLGGEALMPARTAMMVRVQGNHRLTEPAPSTELELSGFYIVDCDEQQAVDIAARMPVATHGAVEIRALMDFADGVS